MLGSESKVNSVEVNNFLKNCLLMNKALPNEFSKPQKLVLQYSFKKTFFNTLL